MSQTGVDRSRWGAVARVIGVVVIASVVAVLPLAFTLFGVVMLVAWLQGGWDPTWNDGDGWFGAIAAGLLVLVLGGTAAAAGAVAHAGHLPARRIAAVSVPATLVCAFAPILIFWIVPRP